MSGFEDDLFSVFEDNDTENNTQLSVENTKEEKDDIQIVNSLHLPTEIIGVKRNVKTEENSDSLKKFKTEPTISHNDTKVDDMMSDEEEEETIAEDDDKIASLVEAAPRFAIHTLETFSSCTHEVAVPPNQEYAPLKTSIRTTPAKTYPFKLDSFQKEAILCIENNQSVLVSAHTSAGKTVTAVYAIAVALEEKRRVIYTTPIKALSNQKYREFYEEFSDVGLMTGDITINPSASCLIMTTEILRSMLYRGSEIMREVGWVIFDEIHYMRDKERGVVWEETLILLPENVHYVFLSATIPNARQFAEWIAHLKHQPCHVVYTDYRPTPLQHFIFPAGGDGVHLVVDEKGNFKEDNFMQAMGCLQNQSASGGPMGSSEPKKRKKNSSKDGSNCFKIVKMIMERDFAPAIIFSFSKKECEAYATQMCKLDFNSADEKKLVEEVFQSAIMVLSDEDRCIPQVENILPLLRRGIGIHHGGLLPILKETVEILFGEGLIKALFATETFAMGLNMPARTVVFTSAQKFDGVDFRWVSSGEYIQMSGRAGRRGIDERGLVILMVDEKMSPAVGRDLVKGLPDPINSAFHLTYNMVLNLLRVEEINPEYMMERSFYQFQNFTTIPALYEEMKEKSRKVNSFHIDDEEGVASYHLIREQLNSLGKEFQSWLVRPQYLVPFLQTGRLVKIKHDDKDFGYGVVIGFKKQTVQERLSSNPTNSPGFSYIVDALIHVTEETACCKSTSDLMPASNIPNSKSQMILVPMKLDLIQQISSVRIFIPQDIRPKDNRNAVQKSIQQVLIRFPEGVPLLDPIKDMKIGAKEFKDIVNRIKAFEDRLIAHRCHKLAVAGQLDHKMELYGQKLAAKAELATARAKLRSAKSLLQMDQLKCMKRVLRRLGYSTKADVIEIKGRIACELSSADVLLLTEMMFNGMFNDMNSAQCAAIVSCLVCDEKKNDLPKLTEELTGSLRTMQEMARRIARVSKDAKINMEEDEYVDKFKPFMMDIVHEWCNGASFFSICKMSDIFEGNIIRTMRRLEELLRQMVQAAKSIGDSNLEIKFSESIKQLKRDIVFAASLYL